MSNISFNSWINIDYNNIDIVADYICTGKTPKEFKPEPELYKVLDKCNPLNILDFGCGIGRNSFGMASYSALWNITGYDNMKMISLTDNYKNIKYNNTIIDNVKFESDWDIVKNMKFDCIYCSLVLQHIYESDLNTYVLDFKRMTSKLVVAGRRFNDEKIAGNYKNTWRILENNGLTPSYSNRRYAIEGDPEEHMLCVYRL